MAAPKTKPAKTPNLGITKRLELQLRNLTRKAVFHTAKATEYQSAADSVQAAIKTLTQNEPTLSKE